jgi:integrase
MRVYRTMTYGQRQKPIEILSEDEVWALIRACSRRAPSGRRDACLLALCAFAGLRTAEALALLPSQVRRNDDGSVEIVDLIGKGGVRRTVHVLPGRETPILDWLEARRRLDIPKRVQANGSRVTPLLICSISMPHPGRPLIPRNVRTMIKRRAAAAGIEKRVHMHGLRHFHAFLLAQKNVKLHVVQQQLGHSRLDTTSTYIAHLSAKDIGDEIRRAFSA